MQQPGVQRRRGTDLSAEQVVLLLSVLLIGLVVYYVRLPFNFHAQQNGTSQYEALEGKTAELEQQHEALKDGMQALKTEVEHLKGRYLSLEEQMGKLQSSLSIAEIERKNVKVGADVPAETAQTRSWAEEKGAEGSNSKKQHFTIVTRFGNITILLRDDKAPKHAAFMRKLISDGLYDGCVFYRAEPGFVPPRPFQHVRCSGCDVGVRQIVQAGPRERSGRVRQKTADSPPLEFNLLNKRGTVHMARWENPDSAEGHFSIALKDSPHLDRTGSSGFQLGFTVFGEVVQGMEVAEAINKLPSSKHKGMLELDEPVVMESVVLA